MTKPKIRTHARNCLTRIKFLLSFSITTYFLWTGVIYLSGALTLFFTLPDIKEFLCNVQAYENKTEDVGRGCENCWDDIIICDKSLCYQNAMNITYESSAKDASMDLHQHYMNAVVDLSCNEKVKNSNSPKEMVALIKQDFSAVSLGCKKFHCEVLKTSLTNNDLYSPTGGSCTDSAGSKRRWDATGCPCQDVTLTLQEARDYNAADMCGNAQGGFIPFLFSYAVGHKNKCFSDSVNSVLPTMSKSDRIAATSSEYCVAMLQGLLPVNPVVSSTIQDMLEASGDEPVCSKVFCPAFVKSTTESACNWDTETSLNDISQAQVEMLNTMCENYVSDMTTTGWLSQQVCAAFNSTLPNYPSWCTSVLGLANLTATTTPGVVNIRRLGYGTPYLAERGGQGEEKSAEGEAWTTGQRQHEGVVLESDGGRCVGEVAPPNTPALIDRVLQETAAAVKAPYDEYPDWTVGDWPSECTCYQQCWPGVRTRVVQCLSEECSVPKPDDKEQCTCDHCAQCNILLDLTFFFWFFVAQAVVALLVFLVFFWMEGRDQSTCIKIGWILWIVGLFCKNLPVLSRLLILANIGQITIILVQVWIPRVDDLVLNPDCGASKILQTISIILASFMILQVTLGRLAKKTRRMPPWLYSPPRERGFLPIRYFYKILGWFGP